MFSKGVMGGGAIIVAILIALTTYMTWPGYLNYIWAVIVLLWGLMSFKWYTNILFLLANMQSRINLKTDKFTIYNNKKIYLRIFLALFTISN